ncbi:hypothetical protein [Pontibacter beigongshangensis]|uniref:hypothetical protein n=1 Tax=Pontibacter beigongshangensis TaxID=2574733 RepID=UPI0016508E20|nr:hypothetical protein [Pontibacter beigongshangensis]
MKHYLLLFLSTLLLLFMLPEPDGRLNRGSGMEQGVLKKACSHQKKIKRTCARKCLQHQAHSGQHNAAGTVTDCSVPSYALVATQEQPVFLPVGLYGAGFVPPAKKYLSPHLGREPDPPRFS